MSDIVNQIDITSVNLSRKENGDYSIHLSWSVNGGYSCGYQGDYILTLYEDCITKDSKTFQDSAAANEVTVEFSGIKLGKKYHIDLGIPESAGGVKSGQEKLIIDYITDISGKLNGNVFEIYWKMTTKNSPVLKCSMVCSNGIHNTYYPNSAVGYYQFSSHDFTPEDTVDITLALTDKDKVTGPVSPVLHFCGSPLFILSAELTKGERTSGLKMTLQSKEDSLAKVKLYCKAEQNLLAELPDVPVTKQQDGTFLLDTAIPDTVISYETLSMCSVYAAALWETAESCLLSGDSMLPLTAPMLRVEEITGEKIRVSVENSNVHYPPMGYELPDGSLLWGAEYTADYDRAFSMCLRPRYDRKGCSRRGTASNTVTSFLPGYYPRKDEEGREYLRFYQGAFTEEVLCHVFTEELFSTHLEESIEQGVLLLEPLEKGYRLTVHAAAPLVREDYIKFVDQIKDKICPYGFYSLCDVLLRLSPQLSGDTAYFQCAFLPERGTADLRPGLILNLATAVYQPQYDPKIASAAGFSAMYSNSYPVTMKKQGTYLEFDCYAGAIAEYMNYSRISNGASNVVFASGILDMLQPAVRQPYYRILYPEKLTHDYSTETPYPSDNMVILTADSYGAILAAGNAVYENRAAINNLPIPLVIFKGRSTLSLHMPVNDNGQSLSVPVGTTVHDILQRQGICGGREFELYRRGDDGREYPVFVKFAENPEDIVLISGDKIICRS